MQAYKLKSIYCVNLQQDGCKLSDMYSGHILCWLSFRNFCFGGFIVIQISFVMLIFLLFLDQILQGGKLLEGDCLPASWIKARLKNSIFLCKSIEKAKKTS